MSGTFSPPPQVSDPDMHLGTCVTHVPWCMPGSLTSGFRWSRGRGKRSWHSRRMHNLRFYVSGKRLIGNQISTTPYNVYYITVNYGTLSTLESVLANCQYSRIILPVVSRIALHFAGSFGSNDTIGIHVVLDNLGRYGTTGLRIFM